MPHHPARDLELLRGLRRREPQRACAPGTTTSEAQREALRPPRSLRQEGHLPVSLDRQRPADTGDRYQLSLPVRKPRSPASSCGSPVRAPPVGPGTPGDTRDPEIIPPACPGPRRQGPSDGSTGPSTCFNARLYSVVAISGSTAAVLYAFAHPDHFHSPSAAGDRVRQPPWRAVPANSAGLPLSLPLDSPG